MKSAHIIGWPKFSHACLSCTEQANIGRYGQDCHSVLSLPDGLTAIILADGHGKYFGHDFARLAVWYARLLFEEPCIQDCLMMPEVLNALIVKLNEQVLSHIPGRSGGTTMSIMVFRSHDFADEKIVEVCSAYVGDSPMYVRVNGEIHEMGGSDNCDNYDAIIKYYQYCKLYGREPGEIVYNRINCPGEQDLSEFGLVGTLPVVNNQDGVPVLNQESYDKILQVWPQFKEGFPIQSLGVLSQNFGLGYKLFGNTIQPGNTQALTGIGDVGVNGILKHAGCVPTAQYRTFSCPSTSTIELAVMSDGMSDLGSPTEVMDLLESCVGLESDQSKMMIARHVRSIAPELYDEYYRDDHGSFKHDDVTGVYYKL